MSHWKDTMNPHWRTDELNADLRKALQRIESLESAQRESDQKIRSLERRLRIETENRHIEGQGSGR